MTPPRYSDIPEVLSVQVIPFGEVRMVPDLPTLTNNPVEVVVELSVLVVLDVLLLLQEMKVELKRNMEEMMSICLTWFPIGVLGEPYMYHDLGEFTSMWGFYLEGSEYGLDYWGGFWQEV